MHWLRVKPYTKMSVQLYVRKYLTVNIAPTTSNTLQSFVIEGTDV